MWSVHVPFCRAQGTARRAQVNPTLDLGYYYLSALACPAGGAAISCEIRVPGRRPSGVDYPATCFRKALNSSRTLSCSRPKATVACR